MPSFKNRLTENERWQLVLLAPLLRRKSRAAATREEFRSANGEKARIATLQSQIKTASTL